MKKDLRSYEQHNKEYLEYADKFDKGIGTIDIEEKLDMFKANGFEYAIRMSNPLPKTHVDIGSGAGWLIRKTSPLFKKVIGIEPSQKAIETAKKISHNIDNVTFINEDMVDGMKTIDISEPIFITTSVVLSHIEDYYVAEFLKHVNNLPANSTLYFGEFYGKNLQWPMWHIRSQDWWIKNLPNWQLFFFNIKGGAYSGGIHGVCVGKNNVLVNNKMDYLENFFWKTGGIFNFIKRGFNKIIKILRLKNN